jgi:hypothetical protein
MSALRTFTLLLALLAGAARDAAAQAVAVTLRLETNTIVVCDTTLLRVYAQVVPSLRSNAEQIVTWYVDVLNSNGGVARADYALLAKPASDNDPRTSSAGFTDGANRRGIYDTFLELGGAGVASPVELLVVPVTGLAPGVARFRVQAGTGVPALAEDFIVAPQGGDEAWTGGDYTAALVDLTVVDSPRSAYRRLAIEHAALPGGTNKVTLRYEADGLCDLFVEYRDQLESGPPWQALPGGPHRAGIVCDTNTVPMRFYRVRASPPPGDPPAN